MNPRIAANQQRRFLEFLAALRPHVRTDPALPRRLRELLGRDRATGSRDRRLYRELLYTALRHWPWVEDLAAADPDPAARLIAWLAPATRDTAGFREALCAGWPAVPASAAARAELISSRLPHPLDPAALLPAWFRDHCPEACRPPHDDAMLARAPLWLRLQSDDRAAVEAEFSRLGWSFAPFPGVPDALRLPAEAAVERTDAYATGLVEIQDLGSQLILLHAPVEPGSSWLDACAGAGGKSLQLARLVGPAGKVDATDTRAEALAELRERARRAGCANLHTPAMPQATYDGVLVDAPCSGTGTWRRAPHLKWVTTPASIERFAAAQREILAASVTRVRPGGLLVYATCSLSRVENEDVVAAFLATHPGFSAMPPARDWGGRRDACGTTLLPGTHDTDGFYVAVLRRA